MKVGLNQKTSPIRHCFFVLPGNLDSFNQAVDIAFSTWGGITAPILPFYEELPDNYRAEFLIDISTANYYRNTLANYDIDIIIYDNALDRKLLDLLGLEIPIVSVDEFINKTSSSVDSYGIPIIPVAAYVADKEFKFTRSDNAKFYLPDIVSSETFLRTWIGHFTNDTKDTVVDIFTNYNALTTISVDWDTVVSYKTDEHLGPTFLNIYGLSFWNNQRFDPGPLFYIFNAKRLQDVNSFWNLRAAGRFIIPLLVDAPNQAINTFLFDKFYPQMVESKAGQMIVMVNCLIGHNCTTDILQKLKHNYHTQNPSAPCGHLSKQDWFPRFWSVHEVQVADHIKSITPYCNSHFEHYELEEEIVKLEPLSLPFDVGHKRKDSMSYKVMVETILYDHYAELAGLLADISMKQIKRLLNQYSSSRNWRVSAGTLHLPISLYREGMPVDIAVPKAIDFFTHYFNNKGYKLIETPNSKLAKEVYKNIEGIYGSHYYLDKDRLKIIESFEGGTDISYSALVGEIKKNLGNNSNAEHFIERLIKNKIIEFGAKIKCSVCEQHGFFLPEDIFANLTCPICRNNFNLPAACPNQIVWGYRGIGPFSRSNKADGVMSVFAALRLFTEHIVNNDRISPLIGFQLVKSGKVVDTAPKEVDLCLLVANKYEKFADPDLIFCECKTYAYLKEIDIERMQMLGDHFPGSILVFATLNNELTATEKGLIEKLVQHFQTGYGARPQNPVLILTGVELLSADPAFPLNDYDDQMHASQRYKDYIGALCELSVKKHLTIHNWWQKKDVEREHERNRRTSIGNLVDVIHKWKIQSMFPQTGGEEEKKKKGGLDQGV